MIACGGGKDLTVTTVIKADFRDKGKNQHGASEAKRDAAV
jgi:hypothetical protein